MAVMNERKGDYVQGYGILYSSPIKQASFNALIQYKNRTIYQSSRCEAKPIKSPMLYSQFSNRSTNK